MHKSKSVVTIFTFMHSYSYACMHAHAVKLGSYSYILAKPAYTHHTSICGDSHF